MTMLKAKKHLGQNFLKNPSILNKIVGEWGLRDTNVIEIGPGPGDLTAAIVRQEPLSLALIEIDDDMIPLLRERFAWENIAIYHQDVLQTNIQESTTPLTEGQLCTYKNKTIETPPYKLYGNIPYYITSPIIYHILYEIDYAPTSMTITMQKEVAERILARDNKHSVLSLTCQLMADMHRICDISPNNFVPAPKVWSTCLEFDIKKDSNREINKKLLQIIKTGFSQKRKKLVSNLTNNTKYSKEKITATFEKIWLSAEIRAEDVTLEQWRELGRHLLDA